MFNIIRVSLYKFLKLVKNPRGQQFKYDHLYGEDEWVFELQEVFMERGMNEEAALAVAYLIGDDIDQFTNSTVHIYKTLQNIYYHIMVD